MSVYHKGSLILKPANVFIYLHIINKIIHKVIQLSNYVGPYPVCKFLVLQDDLITTLAGDFSTTQCIQKEKFLSLQHIFLTSGSLCVQTVSVLRLN